MQNLAEIELIKCEANSKSEIEVKELESKVEFLTNKLDQVYTDKLNAILSIEDFERIYSKIKEERQNYIDKLNSLKKKAENKIDNHAKAKEFALRFVNEINVNKELVFSLIERIEITSDKQIIIYWAFNEMEYLQ